MNDKRIYRPIFPAKLEPSSTGEFIADKISHWLCVIQKSTNFLLHDNIIRFASILSFVCHRLQKWYTNISRELKNQQVANSVCLDCLNVTLPTENSHVVAKLLCPYICYWVTAAEAANASSETVTFDLKALHALLTQHPFFQLQGPKRKPKNKLTIFEIRVGKNVLT